jgi:tetratricopeptide (TPR) repeat protein
MSEKLFLYSLATFRELILSAFQIAGVKRIAEVGSEYGTFTQDLCAHARSVGGKLISIDPYPQQKALDFVHLHQGQSYFEFVQKTSVEALPELYDIDAHIIDGDHNYYTVKRELELIHANRGTAPWLVFQHDVCWPCGRRDMYYNPAAIPLEHLQPNTSEKGLTLDNTGVIDGGFRGDGTSAFALREGGPVNGVRTGIEDFLREHPELQFEVVPAVLGLGIIYSKNAPWSKQISALFQPYTNCSFLERIERNRLLLHLKVIELEDELRNLRNDAASPKEPENTSILPKATSQDSGSISNPIFVSSSSPEESAALARQVEALVSQGQVWSATLVARRAVETDPQSIEALKVLADLLHAQGAWDEAGLAYERLAVRFPDDLVLWQRRLECAWKQGHQVLADIVREEALERHPEWASHLSDISPANNQDHSDMEAVGGRGCFEQSSVGAANF